MSTRRALHFVFKVSDRKETIRFYSEVLGMKVLRHEEFEEGCKATCNGPYDGKWSKTMIGYGPEDKHFVAELTYNYGVQSYKLGNDFVGIVINSKDILDRVNSHSWKIDEENEMKFLQSPGGYRYFIDESLKSCGPDPVLKVILACSNLQKSVGYWHTILGMKIYEQSGRSAVLGFSDEQCKLELQQIDEPVRHEQAFGRIAFSCSTNELVSIQEAVEKENYTVLTKLVSLDTPGKATVHVVILADPDGHEICFVGDESFRELSQVDPDGEKKLLEAIEADKSDEWFAKKGKSKIRK